MVLLMDGDRVTNDDVHKRSEIEKQFRNKVS